MPRPMECGCKKPRTRRSKMEGRQRESGCISTSTTPQLSDSVQYCPACREDTTTRERMRVQCNAARRTSTCYRSVCEAGRAWLTGNMEGGWILTADVQLNPGSPILSAYGAATSRSGSSLLLLSRPTRMRNWAMLSFPCRHAPRAFMTPAMPTSGTDREGSAYSSEVASPVSASQPLMRGKNYLQICKCWVSIGEYGDPKRAVLAAGQSRTEHRLVAIALGVVGCRQKVYNCRLWAAGVGVLNPFPIQLGCT